MTRRLSAVHVVLTLSALAFTTVTPALAEAVTYSTTGGFSASGGAGSATFGGAGNTLTLTFSGIDDAMVDAAPSSNASAGFIMAAVTGTGGTATGNFTLTIDQTEPSVASGGLSGVLSGQITSNTSTGIVDFTSTTLTLGNVLYTLQQPVGGYELVPPSTLNGETSIQMQIDVTTVPEPAFFGLTGLGFLVIAGITYRRRRQSRAQACQGAA
jgi:hypothetical protein